MAGEKLSCSMGSPVWCSMMTWRNGVEAGERGVEGRLDCSPCSPFCLLHLIWYYSCTQNTVQHESNGNYFYTPWLRYALKI